ncbi:MAG: hypothetical protein GWP10_21485 [Nitrospiraceae bacterium]|nr:hypothetical protein [Nitrospiraceae bacterium]
MRSIGIAVRVLLVIALAGLGLPAGVQAQEPDQCSSVRIADETGMPLAAVLEVIGRLLG